MRGPASALVSLCLLAGGTAPGRAEEKLPPAPERYFNDYAGIVPAAEARRLDQKLGDFAKQTSTQVVVAVFPDLPSLSLEDFTVRTAEAWRVGRKEWDNGAVFFVFVNDRKMRIETGYGLEGALPDALAFRILEERVKPRFRTGDWTGGLEAGIDGIIAATRGEYAAPSQKARRVSPLVVLVVFLLILVLLAWIGSRASGGGRGGRGIMVPGGRTYSRRGWDHWSGGWGGGSGGGGGFGGGFGGGGGFSGGGGSFGGGGASSSW